MTSKLLGGAIGALLALWGAISQAGPISYSATSLGGNQWRYDYVLSSDASTPAFDEFTIYFDLGLASGLTLPSAPAGWDPIAINPDAGIPADGYYDALSLGGLFLPGDAASGFSVTFTFLGASTPGSQRFDLIESSTFSVVGSGSTSELAPDDNTVPAPSTASLLLASIVASCLRYWKAPPTARPRQ